MKTVITCAITGAVTSKEQTPYLPVTPEEIAVSSLEAAEAGAAVVHIHVRDPETSLPSMNVEYYRDVVDRIRKENNELIINLTTGPGAYYLPSMTNLAQGAPSSLLLMPDKRVEHIELIRPDICSIDFNTMHQAGDGIRINHRRITREMVKRVQAVGCKPELEIFDSGDFRIAKELVDEGIIDSPPLWQFAMGIKYGWDATPETLDYARRQLLPGTTWSAFGIGRMEMPMVAQSWLYGGHVRVGLEDNIYLEKGVLAKTNAELVAKAARIIKDLGGQIADCRESRDILNLYKKKDKIIFYKKLDIPPIPEDLLTFSEAETTVVDDIGYNETHRKEEQLITPCRYVYNRVNNEELQKWISQHVPEATIQNTLLQIQESKNNKPSTHVVHSDVNRRSALNYIIDTGGPNVVTSWYQQKGKPLYRPKSIKGKQTNEGYVDYCDLDLLESTMFEKGSWYILDVEILHDVDNITATRKSITISLPNKKYLE